MSDLIRLAIIIAFIMPVCIFADDDVPHADFKSVGEWQKDISVDPLTDEVTLMIGVVPLDEDSDISVIGISCRGGEVHIVFSGNRINRQGSVIVGWDLKSFHKVMLMRLWAYGGSFPNAKEYLRRMLEHDSMTIEIPKRRGWPETFILELEGLKSIIEKHRPLCGLEEE